MKKIEMIEIENYLNEMAIMNVQRTSKQKKKCYPFFGMNFIYNLCTGKCQKYDAKKTISFSTQPIKILRTL